MFTMFPNQFAISPGSTNTSLTVAKKKIILALHSPLVNCSEDINNKVETLNEKKDSNDEEETKKANIDENVSIVRG